MVREFFAKKSVQPVLDVEKLHTLVMELDEQTQESILGGNNQYSTTTNNQSQNVRRRSRTKITFLAMENNL